MKKSEKKTYGVIGLGRFGSALAHELAVSGADVLAVDVDENAVKEVRDEVENALVSDDLSEDSLRRMGFGECDVVIVCIGSILDVSMLTVLNVMSLGVKRVIAKASSKAHGQLLEKIGAEVIYPERDSGISLAHTLTSSGLLDAIRLSRDVDIAEVSLPERLNGVTVLDSGLRKDYGLNIVAISRNDRTITNVLPQEVLQSGDNLLLIGSNAGFRKLME